MIVEALIIASAAGTALVPAVGMWWSGRSKRTQLKEAQENLRNLEAKVVNDRTKFYELGRKRALEEVEKMREETPSLSYREAARKAAKACAECGRSCVHCAKEDK